METMEASHAEIQVIIRYETNAQKSVVHVDRFPFLIGRDSSSVQLALPDSKVSRIHARLLCKDGAVLLENISTTNKTAVNGRLVERSISINSGDQAVMGSCHLYFEVETHTTQETGPELLPRGGAEIGTGSTEQPMFCSSCGGKISDGAIFCPWCGKPAGQGKQADTNRSPVSPSTRLASFLKGDMKLPIPVIVAILALIVIVIAAVAWFR